MWRQDTKAAEPRAKLSRRRLRWALEGIVIAHLTVGLVAEGKRVLVNDSSRFDGVRVVGLDEHVVRHEALLFRM